MTTFITQLSTLSQQQSYRRTETIKSLETLIAPLSLKEFFKKYWKRKAAIIADDNPQKFRQLLHWEQLQNLLVDCPENHMKCFDNGPPIPGEKANLLQRWHQGQTLHIERIEKLVPALEQLSGQIAEELKASTKMYAFCSHPNRPGAHLHYDRFDVFVLQIQGYKKWQVQLTRGRKPYLERVLQPGDLLYLPRGHWHQAVASQEQSLHLTLGISFNNFNDSPLEESTFSPFLLKLKNKILKRF
jgi:ribosomal protein L16 Arg81 hydroxylase